MMIIWKRMNFEGKRSSRKRPYVEHWMKETEKEEYLVKLDSIRILPLALCSCWLCSHCTPLLTSWVNIFCMNVSSQSSISRKAHTKCKVSGRRASRIWTNKDGNRIIDGRTERNGYKNWIRKRWDKKRMRRVKRFSPLFKRKSSSTSESDLNNNHMIDFRWNLFWIAIWSHIIALLVNYMPSCIPNQRASFLCAGIIWSSITPHILAMKQTLF